MVQLAQVGSELFCSEARWATTRFLEDFAPSDLWDQGSQSLHSILAVKNTSATVLFLYKTSNFFGTNTLWDAEVDQEQPRALRHSGGR